MREERLQSHLILLVMGEEIFRLTLSPGCQRRPGPVEPAMNDSLSAWRSEGRGQTFATTPCDSHPGVSDIYPRFHTILTSRGGKPKTFSTSMRATEREKGASVDFRSCGLVRASERKKKGIIKKSREEFHHVLGKRPPGVSKQRENPKTPVLILNDAHHHYPHTTVSGRPECLWAVVWRERESIGFTSDSVDCPRSVNERAPPPVCADVVLLAAFLCCAGRASRAMSRSRWTGPCA